MKLFHRKAPQIVATLPVLQTERLVLRAFDVSDAVDVFAYAQSEKVGPMAGWAPHKTLADSRLVVDMFIRSGEVWAVVEKKSGHVIGSVGLHKSARNVPGALELGYALGEKHWGLGYATEACEAALRCAFDERACPVVTCGHFPANARSKRVIKKLGFTYEGTLRCAWQLPDGACTDECVYSLLRDEYWAQRAPHGRE